MKIILAPIDKYDRKEMEHIENGRLKEQAFEYLIEQGCQIYELTDFMDMCNSQEIDLEHFWISYIQN